MQARSHRKEAFTLVELLVVTAIVGILLALLLPAVQAAREAARRSQCVNQMRQLAVAALNFESSVNRLPGGTGFYQLDFNAGPTGGREEAGPKVVYSRTPKHWTGLGWIVEVLPFIELQSLYDKVSRLNYEVHKGNVFKMTAEEVELIKIQPTGLACPTDPDGRVLINTQYQWPNVWVATTNYRGVMGSNQMIESTSSCPTRLPRQQFCNDGRARCNGLIWRTSSQFPVKLRHITDGASQTMLIGEDLPSHDWHTMWSFSNGDSSSTYCPLNFSLNAPDPESWWDMRGFRSYHLSGANFAFADASVQFIQEDIDFDLYKAMSTAAQQDGLER